jgi:hypothetical protein
MKIYLASACDRNKDNGRTQKIRDELVKTTTGTIIFAPSLGWGLKNPDDEDKRWLININQTALVSADALVIIHSPGIESWGLPQELADAFKAGKTIIVLSEQVHEQLPIYMARFVRPENVVPSVDDIVNALTVG